METMELAMDVESPQAREKYFIELYENAFPSVATFVRHRRGSLQDAKDIFQDALVILYEKKAAGNLNPDLSDEAYLTGIAKHLWLRKFKQEHKYVSLNDLELTITLPDEKVDEPETEHLLNFLERAGEKCLHLLQAFYYEHLTMEKIRVRFNYRSLQSATTQKYKCLEKVREVVKEKSLRYEDFTKGN